MKKLLTALSLTALMVGSAVAAPKEIGSNGVKGAINVQGILVPATCKVNVEGDNHRLGKTLLSSNTYPKLEFNFRLQDCEASNGAVKITFPHSEGGQVAVENGRLKNNPLGHSGGATGIYFEVTDAQGVNVLSDISYAKEISLTDVNVAHQPVRYFIELKKESQVQAGAIQAILPYTVTYK